ncbi:hypothetical protein [Flectobacillus roseus]|uniref:hypothetical protein n=1 Tax=Flectobacillus roseus TaxID=502259 RepID=UPI0024B8763F|nr:hypothetical protein [Flectobacillus roseus]MDI9872092.1 hypothetical protein [Flectobacillus roseus]
MLGQLNTSKRARKLGWLLILVSILCTVMTCKGQSTPSSTDELEQVKKLVPKGYIVFTVDGAKKALKYREDALAFDYQNKIKDTLITSLSNENALLRLENTNLKKEVKQLKTAKTLSTIERWGYRALLLAKFIGLL